MKNKQIGLLLIALPVLGILWFLFRPELLFVNQKVNESLPTATSTQMGSDSNGMASAPQLLRSGTFTSLAHQTKGTAGIYEIDGKKVLRLSEFETSNGPDVRVYLVEGNDGKDSKIINGGGYIDLGVLKGNQGDQNYEIPDTIDLSKYNGVSIWCKRFAVNFGGASLQ